MRKQLVAVGVALVSATALGSASAQTDSKSLVPKLAGTWTAAPFELKLTSDLDVSVWGAGASSVRKVELTIQPSGEGHIKVTRSIVDARGKVKAASTSVEEANIVVRDPKSSEPGRVEFQVEVQNPERKYPDDPKDKWPLNGLAVKLVATDLENNRLNLHFDLPDGRGSFGETLTRGGTRPAQRSSQGAVQSQRRGR